MRNFYFLILCFGSIFTLQAQQYYNWAYSFGDSFSNTKINTVEVDSWENIYVGGEFKNSITLATNDTSITFTSNGGVDAFIIKYDSSGYLLAARQIGGSGNEAVYDIKYQAYGDELHVVGSFEDTVNFNGEYHLSEGGKDAFYLQMFPGSLGFNRIFSWGGSNDVEATCFGIDKALGIPIYLIGGIFNGTVDLDPDAINTTYETSTGGTDAFCLKIKSNQYHGHFTVESSGDDYMEIIESNEEYYYITGYAGLGSAGAVYMSGSTYLGSTSGTEDAGFMLAYKYDENFQWSTFMNGRDSRSFTAITSDTLTDDVYFTAIFKDSLSMDSTPVVASDHDIALGKLNKSGKLEWLKSYQSTGIDFPTGIDFYNDHVYLGGSFTGTLEIPSSSTLNVTADNTDMFVIMTDTNGSEISTLSLGGPGSDAPLDLILDEKGSLILVGTHQGITDFDPSIDNSEELISNGNDDAFILRLSNYEKAQDTLSINEQKSNIVIRCYPNPAENHINVDFPDGLNSSLKYALVNIHGQCIHSGILDGKRNVIDLNITPKGLYLLNIYTDKTGEILYSRKLIKQR